MPTASVTTDVAAASGAARRLAAASLRVHSSRLAVAGMGTFHVLSSHSIRSRLNFYSVFGSDDCRFPHVSPDAAPTPVHHAPPPFMGRRGGFRGPPVHHVHANSVNGVNGAQANGNGAVNGLEDGFANLNVRDVSLQLYPALGNIS